MPNNEPITPPDEHVLTAKEAIEPLYDRLETATDRAVMAAAVAAGWSAEDATTALAALRMRDAMAVMKR
ncbi:hypothetical protein SAMN03159496_05585 [Rhizobium sp. NFR07]|uniref:hypothetical protein n=1 Tax=Rhizobium sp. NFR07 TaxID=1566262 RepID=UPI0008E27EFF|nr:hypothetical protein [Rhizobium sp. NFR07]SFB59693.1 hypothetical protein SAMN03159496_05585 [Rhizobium sp. NFR07]